MHKGSAQRCKQGTRGGCFFSLGAYLPHTFWKADGTRKYVLACARTNKTVDGHENSCMAMKIHAWPWKFMQVYAMVSVYLLSGCEAVHGKNVGLFLGGYLNEVDWTKQNCNLCCALQFYVGVNEVGQISGSQQCLENWTEVVFSWWAVISLIQLS